MGTKNNPGVYDCYAIAEPDEPIFILLARDPLAPALVRLWADIRKQQGCKDHPYRSHEDKANEALQCANAMQEWREQKALSETLSVASAIRCDFRYRNNGPRCLLALGHTVDHTFSDCP